MANKTLQRERMKGYFIDSTKKILIEEGLDAITVRRVAEDAGYGYTTLYNYFDNQNDLLWQTSISLMQGLEAQVMNLAQRETYSNEDLTAMVLLYMNYMFDKPNVFKLFFMYEFNKHNGPIEIVPYEPVFPRILGTIVTQFADRGVLHHSKVKLICEVIIFTVHGLLTMSLSGRADISRDASIEKIIEIIHTHIPMEEEAGK